MEKGAEFFILDDQMYHVSQILYLKLAGGAYGYGCWGKIQLIGMEAPVDIGDGSYRNSITHIKHMVAGEYNFKRLRRIMREFGVEKESEVGG
ncbi:MAG: hypothetical protein PHO67_07775 [Candidatus Omnitrophica bacterium]|nr:hypothetical protein [Candidatus Omnitrophota bacterium]